MTMSVETDRNIPQRGGTPWGKPFPAHWGAVPLFSELRERQIKNKGNVEGNVLSLSYGRIVRRDVDRLQSDDPVDDRWEHRPRHGRDDVELGELAVEVAHGALDLG